MHSNIRNNIRFGTAVSMLGKILADDIFKYISYLSQKNRLSHSMQVDKACESLFSFEKYENISFNLSFGRFAQRLVNTKVSNPKCHFDISVLYPRLYISTSEQQPVLYLYQGRNSKMSKGTCMKVHVKTSCQNESTQSDEGFCSLLKDCDW